jgi:hypothetical protein
MTWEWDSRSTPHRWALNAGEWQAVVQRGAGPRYQWQAAIEYLGAPHQRLSGPACADAMLARAWCLRKIAELRGAHRYAA